MSWISDMSNPNNIMPNTPVIDIAVRCKARTEYDTTPASENMRFQIGGDDSAYLDISVRGPLTGKIAKGGQYQITITEITG